MKSSIKKNTFKAIYRLLDKVSPVNGDCGLLCGSICCTYEYENADYSNIDDAARTATDSSSSTGDTGNGGHPEAPDAVCCSKGSGDDDSLSASIFFPARKNSFSGDEEWLGWSWAYAEDTNSPTAGTESVFPAMSQCTSLRPRHASSAVPDVPSGPSHR